MKPIHSLLHTLQKHLMRKREKTLTRLITMLPKELSKKPRDLRTVCAVQAYGIVVGPCLAWDRQLPRTQQKRKAIEARGRQQDIACSKGEELHWPQVSVEAKEDCHAHGEAPGEGDPRGNSASHLIWHWMPPMRRSKAMPPTKCTGGPRQGPRAELREEMAPGCKQSVSRSGSDAFQKAFVHVLGQGHVHSRWRVQSQMQQRAVEQKGGHSAPVTVQRCRGDGQALQQLPAPTCRRRLCLTYACCGGLPRSPQPIGPPGAGRGSEGRRHQAGCLKAELLHQWRARWVW